jgi:hypothetical protein
MPLAECLCGALHRVVAKGVPGPHNHIFNESSLRRILKAYFEYYEHSRTHPALEKDAPASRVIQPRELGEIVEVRKLVACITGCVFKTSPGWCLHIRSPINSDLDQPYRIQEGMLETDWMQYAIWMNLKFFRYNEPVRLRRNQRYPLAQLVPVRRESYDGKWNLQDNTLNCVRAEKEKGVEIFDS